MIECGAQFSLALTKFGQVWTWGKGDYFRLGHGSDQHVRKPTLVEGLSNKKIVHVAVGALHCLCVTDQGQVYAWGDNDHGQQGNGTTAVNRKPSLVHNLEGMRINRVACGSSHSVAWTTFDTQMPNMTEPVIFGSLKDPLGALCLSKYFKNKFFLFERGFVKNFFVVESADSFDQDPSPEPGTSNSNSKSSRSTLSQIVLSLESNVAKQQALQHILVALQVLHARDSVVAALSSHSSNVMSTPRDTLKCSPDTPAEDIGSNPLLQIAQGGGEAPANVSEAMITVRE